ncbi:hypothetical protein [Taibaiella helva]|uniref:hypothetical protein n=1 Tax=Taibaiella helva TaxID=2301235 RepID=UPI000E571A0C|nr:hypothetical protein [Taibaiella helva]
MTQHESNAAKEGYPAYQLYADNAGATYCSKKKVSSHAEGNGWIKACLSAHPGTSCQGKPWLSNTQSGTIWWPPPPPRS